MSATITCKKCGTVISLDDALTLEIEEKLKQEYERKQKERETALQKKISEIEKEEILLEHKRKSIDDLVTEKMKAGREEMLKTLKQQVTLEKETEVKFFREQLDETVKKLKQAQQNELDLRKDRMKLEEEQKNFELEKQRQLDMERKKIEETARNRSDEENKFKIAELTKKLTDFEAANKDLMYKLQQGSQQLQGEVLELDLEEQLKKTFIYDDITPIEKGERGADIFQKVRNSFGQTAGIILWETKRAKWNQSWLAKLREDARKAGASISVLVTEETPKDIKNFEFIDNVLITNLIYSIPLAGLLRRWILHVAMAKSTAVNKDEKLEKLYRYLQSEAFRHRFEAYVDGIITMQQDLETEKRSTLRLWKRREVQISNTLDNIANMYGELQGIMGSTLPDIKLLSLPTSKDEKQVLSSEQLMVEK